MPLTSVPTGVWGQEATGRCSPVLGAQGMLDWEKGVYCQPGFPPQLPNTWLERNFFP